MSRATRAVLVLVLLGTAARILAAEPERLVFPRDEAVVRAAREYFDDSADAWTGRKRLREELESLAGAGIEPLRDLDWLQRVLLQGRSFREEFENSAWRRAHGAEVDRRGPVTDVVAKGIRLTLAVPTADRGRAALARIPRPDPWPLLFVLHEPGDDPEGGEGLPGGRALARWWPKADFGPVYQDWMLLAPAAPQGAFVAEDGTVRRDLTLQAFRECWQRYHVDFERVVLDGAEAALAVAASQPAFFAGLVLRGGAVDPALVRNFASLPVYVVGKPALADALLAAGHPNVSRGDAAGLLPWLAERRRVLPTTFSWTAARPDQVLAHWVSLEPEAEAVERRLDVSVDREQNRIRIDAVGVSTLQVFLNDRIVDLDREVDLVVNGVARRERFPRDFDRLLDRDPLRVRRTLYLGWLFPAIWTGIEVGPPAPAQERPAAEPGPSLPQASLDRALSDFLLGRPDLTARALREAPVAADAWPAALVDHWWRPRGLPEDQVRLDRVRQGFASGDPLVPGMAGLYTWLSARDFLEPWGSGAEDAPHRVYVAAAADRVARETAGLAAVASGPLQDLRADPRVGEILRWFLDDVQAPAYAGPSDDPRGEPARRAAEGGPRNAWLAVASVLGLLLLAAALGRMARGAPRSPPRA